MGACTFFGHRDAPACVKQDIQNAVMRLIKEHGIRRFYVGNHGHFDTYVQDILLQLKAAHSVTPMINVIHGCCLIQILLSAFSVTTQAEPHGMLKWLKKWEKQSYTF